MIPTRPALRLALAATLLALSGCTDFDKLYSDCVARGVCAASALGEVNALVSTVTVDRPSGVLADGTDAAQITVVVRDGSGNALPGQTVTLSATGTGNSFEQPAVTDAAGACTGKLRSTVSGSKTVSATVTLVSGDVALAAQPTVAFQAGPPTALAFSSPPSSGSALAPFSPTVEVSVLDAQGNVAASDTHAVSLALTAGTSGVTLTGATSVSAVAGIATFADLGLSAPGAGFVITASASGLTSASSAAFDRVPAVPSPTLSTVTTDLATLPADGLSQVTITVTVKDADGLPLRGQQVTVSASGGGNTLVQPGGPTDAAGVASAKLSSSQTGTQTLSATVDPGGPLVVLAAQPTVTFTSAPPRIVAAAPSGTASGCVPLSYSVSQLQGLPVDVRVEVDPLGTGAFVSATQAGSSTFDGVTALAPGAHTFFWNSTADLASQKSAAAKLRLTAQSVGLASTAQVLPLTVDNGLSFSAVPDLVTVVAGVRVVAGDVNRDGWQDLVAMRSGGPIVLLNQGDGGFNGVSTPAVPTTLQALALTDLNRDGRLDLVASNTPGSILTFLGQGDGTFTFSSDQDVGFSSVAMDVADFNRDGIPDVVLGNHNSSGFGVAPGIGDGGFPDTFPIVTTGLDTSALVAADFNRDGKQDVASLARDSATLAVSLGDGAGGFAAPLSSPLVLGAHHLRAGDMNGDGRLDAIALTDTSVLVCLGNGDGQFQPPVTATVGTDTTGGLLVADLDGDGRLDVALTRRNSGALVTLRGNGDGTLRPPVTLAVGTFPVSAVPVDLNADGKLDLAVVSDGTAGIVVRLNGTPGRCDPLLQGPSGPLGNANGPSALVVADFNRDGKPDVATAERSPGALAVAFGLGNGTFGPLTRTASGPSPWAIAAGNFDGDAWLDLILANFSGSSVTLFSGTPTGAFPAGTDTTVGVYPAALLTGDLDQDGALDLLIGGPDYGTLDVVRGNGNGTFQPAVAYDAGVGLSGLALGDFNHDGQLDVAEANNAGLSIHYGLDAGALAPGVRVATAAVRPNGLATVDLDRDGRLELAVCHVGDGGLSVYAEDGGAFSETGWYAVTSPGADQQCGAPLVADFDRDGLDDLAVPVTNARQVGVLLGGDGGSLRLAGAFPVGSNPLELGAADFDGDGKLDLSIVDQSTGAVILRGNGDGTFRAAPTRAVFNTPVHAVQGDFDGDGKLDVAVLDGDEISVLRGVGDGTLQPVSAYSPDAGLGAGSGVGATRMAVADFDGDGKLDLVTANTGSTSMSLLRGDGAGGFLAPTAIAVGYATWRVLAADVNGDGRPDLVETNLTYTTGVLLNQGGGSFGAPINKSTTQPTDGLVAGDFNLDGKLDLVLQYTPSGLLRVVLGAGNGSFGNETAIATVGGAVLTVGDVNRDGKLDLLSATIGSPSNLQIHLGTGSGAFTALSPIPLANGLRDIAVGDLNGDGRPDLAISSNGGSSVDLAWGNGSGGFQLGQRVATTGVPIRLLIGDYDGDGRQDVVSVSGDGAVQVLRGLH